MPGLQNNKWCLISISDTTIQNPGTACKHIPQPCPNISVTIQFVEQPITTSISKLTKDVYDICFVHLNTFLLFNNAIFTNNNFDPVLKEILIYFVAQGQPVYNFAILLLLYLWIMYNYLKEMCSDPLELYSGKPFPSLTLILNSVKWSQNQNKGVGLLITFDIPEQTINFKI